MVVNSDLTSLFPAVKPRIVRDNLAPITVKVNQQVMLDVDIIGEPPPTVTWTFKGKVGNGQRTSVKSCSDLVIEMH